jgi:hypothetical protein
LTPIASSSRQPRLLLRGAKSGDLSVFKALKAASAEQLARELQAQGDLSWPRWTISCGPRELRVLFSLATVHDPDPDARALRERGIDAVFRSHPQQLSTTVAVFRWGRRVV